MQSVAMSGATIIGTVLDHVAHAVPRWHDVWTRYVVDLGAEWNSGGPGPGFAPAQLRFGNGARVEVLMPYNVEVNDFLARFITANGPGAHHLTFKVPDLRAALEQVERAGFEPIGVNLSDPEWMEAFIHPKQATGVVVQLAEAPIPWVSQPPPDFPSERRQRDDGSGAVPPASLGRVVHVVANLTVATGLFVELLGGQVVDEGVFADHRWVDLQWGGPLGLRLIAPTNRADPTDPAADRPLADWLGGRSGRIHHLELTVEDPAGISGARPARSSLALMGGRGDQNGFRELLPEENFGLSLVLAPA